MFEVFDNDSIRRILRVRRRVVCRPWNCGAASALQLYRWFSHAAGRPDAHTASHVAQANWRPAEDMGNHDQGRPITPLRTAILRFCTMEKGLGKSLS